MATQAASAPGLYPAVSTTTTAQPPTAKLNPYVQMMPDTSHETWATIWSVASIVTQVAFVVIVTVAILLTGIYDPVFLPVVTAFSLALIDDVLSISEKFQVKSNNERFFAVLEACVGENLEKLPKTSAELHTYLAHIQPPLELPKINKLEEMRPLLARYLGFRELIGKFTEKAEACLKNGEAHPEKLEEMRLQAIHMGEWALASKMFAAYFRTVLINPYFPHDYQDLFDLTFWNKPLQIRLCQEGLLARYEPGNKYEEIFVTFKQPSKKPFLTTREVNSATDIEISAILSGIGTG